MITTQDEHQELAHLRAEVHRLQADSSRAIAALAECIGERDDLKAKLESTKSQMVELKRAFLSAENDVCAYRNKLARVEADAAAMRDVLREVADYDTGEQPSIGSDAETALKPGSGQRLLDELATLRATAQRRKELLRKCEWSAGPAERPQCPMCQAYEHGLKYVGHKPDCVLARELNTQSDT